MPWVYRKPYVNESSGASEKIREQLFKSIPMKRIAKPEEVGNAAAWLLSEESSYITGITLPVDGADGSIKKIGRNVNGIKG